MTQGQGLMGQVWSAYEKHCSECSFFKKMIFWIHDWKQQECQLVQSVPWSNHTSGFSWLQEVMEPNWTSKSVNMEADQSAIKLLLTSIGFCIPCTSTAWWWLVVHCLQTPETWNVHIVFYSWLSCHHSPMCAYQDQPRISEIEIPWKLEVLAWWHEQVCETQKMVGLTLTNISRETADEQVSVMTNHTDDVVAIYLRQYSRNNIIPYLVCRLLMTSAYRMWCWGSCSHLCIGCLHSDAHKENRYLCVLWTYSQLIHQYLIIVSRANTPSMTSNELQFWSCLTSGKFNIN